MVLSDEYLQEQKRILAEANECEQKRASTIAVIKEKGKVGQELIKSYGYSSLSEASELQKQFLALEEEIKAERLEAEEVIVNYAKFEEETREVLAQ